MERQLSPTRLRTSMEILRVFSSRKIVVEGRENLALLKPNEGAILAVTHIKDSSEPLAFAALSKELDLAITNVSGHGRFFSDPFSYIGIKIAGAENFLPFSYRGRLNKWTPDTFQPKDFEPMVEAIKDGKSIIVAAHRPARDGRLPDKPGFGAVYLALLTGAPIVPITVDVQSSLESAGMAGIKGMTATVLIRPRTVLTIHEPMKPEYQLDPNVPVFKQARALIQEQSKIMQTLAESLPPHRRGIWQ